MRNKSFGFIDVLTFISVIIFKILTAIAIIILSGVWHSGRHKNSM